MKIENERYVLTRGIKEESVFLTKDYDFSNDIREALMYRSRLAASYMRSELFDKYVCDLDVVPLKITYEW